MPPHSTSPDMGSGASQKQLPPEVLKNIAPPQCPPAPSPTPTHRPGPGPTPTPRDLIHAHHATVSPRTTRRRANSMNDTPSAASAARVYARSPPTATALMSSAAFPSPFAMPFPDAFNFCPVASPGRGAAAGQAWRLSPNVDDNRKSVVKSENFLTSSNRQQQALSPKSGVSRKRAFHEMDSQDLASAGTVDWRLGFQPKKASNSSPRSALSFDSKSACPGRGFNPACKSSAKAMNQHVTPTSAAEAAVKDDSEAKAAATASSGESVCILHESFRDEIPLCVECESFVYRDVRVERSRILVVGQAISRTENAGQRVVFQKLLESICGRLHVPRRPASLLRLPAGERCYYVAPSPHAARLLCKIGVCEAADTGKAAVDDPVSAASAGSPKLEPKSELASRPPRGANSRSTRRQRKPKTTAAESDRLSNDELVEIFNDLMNVVRGNSATSPTPTRGSGHRSAASLGGDVKLPGEYAIMDTCHWDCSEKTFVHGARENVDDLKKFAKRVPVIKNSLGQFQGSAVRDIYTNTTCHYCQQRPNRVRGSTSASGMSLSPTNDSTCSHSLTPPGSAKDKKINTASSSTSSPSGRGRPQPFFSSRTSKGGGDILSLPSSGPSPNGSGNHAMATHSRNFEVQCSQPQCRKIFCSRPSCVKNLRLGVTRKAEFSALRFVLEMGWVILTCSHCTEAPGTRTCFCNKKAEQRRARSMKGGGHGSGSGVLSTSASAFGGSSRSNSIASAALRIGSDKKRGGSSASMSSSSSSASASLSRSWSRSPDSDRRRACGRRFARKNSSSPERDHEMTFKRENAQKPKPKAGEPVAVATVASPMDIDSQRPSGASLHRHLASLNLQCRLSPTHAASLPVNDAEILKNLEQLRTTFDMAKVGASTSDPQLRAMYDQYVLEVLKGSPSQSISSHSPSPQQNFFEAYMSRMMMQLQNSSGGIEHASSQQRAFLEAFYRTKAAEQSAAFSNGGANPAMAAAAAAAWRASYAHFQQQQQLNAAAGANAFRRHSFCGVPPLATSSPSFANLYADLFAQSGAGAISAAPSPRGGSGVPFATGHSSSDSPSSSSAAAAASSSSSMYFPQNAMTMSAADLAAMLMRGSSIGSGSSTAAAAATSAAEGSRPNSGTPNSPK